MSTWSSRYAALASLLLLMACSAPTVRAPLSVDELRNLSLQTKLTYERPLDASVSFTAYLVSYRYAGLKLHAMVAVPKTRMPDGGYPVVIANHGYVPEPAKYGITSEGIDSRPGDYYRSVPELFTARGFLVVLPDYRGHNSSEGFEFVDPQDENSIAYFAEDVVALLSAVKDIQHADQRNLFIWSHSMGGPVSLRALLATNIAKGSSFWAPMSLQNMHAELDQLNVPVVMHHSLDDQSTSFSNTTQFSDALRALGRDVSTYSYDGAHHYFDETDREIAADRDADFFSRLIDSDH